MEVQCHDCNRQFIGNIKLNKHKKTCPIRWKNIMFICKCNFLAEGQEGYDNIIKHIKECNYSDNSTHIFFQYEKSLQETTTELELCKDRIKKLEDELQTYKNNRPQDKSLMKVVERLKGVLDEMCVDECLEEQAENKKSDTPEPKKSTFRKVKHLDLVSENKNQELREELTKDQSDKLVKDNDDDSELQDIMSNIDMNIEFLKTKSVYTPLLGEINKQRRKLISKMSIYRYSDLLKTHINVISTIFKEKGHNDKKINSIINKCILAIDMRILLGTTKLTKYMSSSYIDSEISDINICLDRSIQHDKEFNPFCDTKLYDCFFNYGSVLFSIKKNIERYLINPYGFWNVIYLPLPNSSSSDPYSFYTLLNIGKNGKRNWKMDCRLDELSSGLFDNLIPYFVGTFRQIYSYVFGDNEYRQDYVSKSPITEYDCEQLLHNIIIISREKQFRIMLCKMIMEKSTYQPTENDKFNFYGDDALVKKRLSEEDRDVVDVIKQLFDGITSVQAVDMLRSID